MLQKLSIHNYALIDSVELELDKGLNIITGETGAGKSIMLGALSLILGQRAETRYFFNQEKKCVIEGIFQLTGDKLKGIFEAHDLDFHQESILRREIAIDGKSRAFINDTPVTLSVMKLIGEQLIDIHSQHATLEVSDSGFQLSVIDTIASHDSALSTYRNEFSTYRKHIRELTALETAAVEARSKQDYEQFLFNELEAANLSAGEQESLEEELSTLTHAEQIKRSLNISYGMISESETALIPMLKEVVNQIQSIEQFNGSYLDLAGRLRSTLIELKDIAEETVALEEHVVYSPAKIDEVQARLDLIYGLQQKHRVTTVEELITIQSSLSDNLAGILSGDNTIEKLKGIIKKSKDLLEVTATKLSANRSKAINIASKQVDAILTQVGMPNARVSFHQEKLAEFNKDGHDQIALLFSANAGQAPAPVGKIASGGELSRLMLAIKSIMAKHTALPTLIFDEIDTGISGETALRVGEVISNLEKNMQVVCITHLPQIAAQGEAHYFVYKNEANKRTTTGIRRLTNDERIDAIAEMLSGKNPAASALDNARDLLGYKNH
ncbi:DNA repair protein RecN [Pedobacter duraquae]|uniref:DNA repair protein RecN n=1 Tax=Pedobacter duraquae TaxID=425511 RepID=A0A4R6IJ92_9SPHI|nr:DNA repair protein RecN [Pedobacter duraquae]TDO22080.1 DNA replication and repair protein RecN [Pedobacter duraquae]